MSFNFFKEFNKKISTEASDTIDYINKDLEKNNIITQEEIQKYFINQDFRNVSYENNSILINSNDFFVNYDPINKEIIQFQINYFENKISEDREKTDTCLVFFNPNRKIKYQFYLRMNDELCFINYSEKENVISNNIEKKMPNVNKETFSFFMSNIFLPKKELVELFNLNFDFDFQSSIFFSDLYNHLNHTMTTILKNNKSQKFNNRL